MNKLTMKKEPVKTREELYQYIPQRPPFVMVDKIFEKAEDFLTSGFLVRSDNVMVENNLFSAGGLVENMAQTAALLAGTKFVDEGKEVPVGYIAGIKNLKINRLPACGEELHTRTIITHDLLNIQVVEGSVFDAQETEIAHCELRIFIKG